MSASKAPQFFWMTLNTFNFGSHVRSASLVSLITLSLTSGIILERIAHLQDGSSSTALEKLRYCLDHGIWVAYAPTGFDPNANPAIIPSDDSIRADLVALHQAGFDGLVTYGADIP